MDETHIVNRVLLERDLIDCRSDVQEIKKALYKANTSLKLLNETLERSYSTMKELKERCDQQQEVIKFLEFQNTIIQTNGKIN